MKITRIGPDLVKNVFRCMELIVTNVLLCVVAYRVGRWKAFSRNWNHA